MSSSPDEQDSDVLTPLQELQIQNLEQMSDEEFWNYARQRAHILPETPTHAEYLECKLSGQTCLIALRNLAEVLPPPHRLARLPGVPAWMAGIAAWRGETIAVVDLDLYLTFSHGVRPAQTAEGMLLVVHSAGRAIGLLVPAIGLTTTIEFEQISPLAGSPVLERVLDAGIFDGVYMDMPIFTISVLLAALVQQIGMATAHG